ncbi:HNH endonuclease signature motif containing protein [Ruania alba]|uniref:DUF222 domain-containing protein n=1 Tax=Ruania alba TaxID=648782 RepID=A0A1H5M5L3_9MICO|nr:HNH endonuclease signature motif containing protein [Ruania alba]SEE84525.1 protein of unknown function [Ruania alba]
MTTTIDTHPGTEPTDTITVVSAPEPTSNTGTSTSDSWIDTGRAGDRDGQGTRPTASTTSEVAAAQVEHRLDQITAELDALVQIDLQELASDRLTGLVDQVESVERRLHAFTHQLATTIEADGTWALTGYRSLPTWWAGHTRRRLGPTRTRIRTATLLRDHLPLTQAALAAGTISDDHATLLAHHATRTPVLISQLTDPDIGEAFLVRQATLLGADQFRRALQAWAIRADPEAADRNWVADADKQHLFVSETLDGYALNGWLTPENGHALRIALEAIVGVPDTSDDRSPSQRLADALITLTHLTLDSGTLQPGARIRPHTTVTVDAHTLHRLVTDHTSGTNEEHHRRNDTNLAGSTGDPADSGCSARPPTGPGPGAETGAGTSAGTGTRTSEVPDGTTIATRIDYTAMTGTEPAMLDDGTPLSPAQLAHLVCGSEFTRVIFDPEGQPLDVGRAQRLHTRAQATAIVARDKHCAYPGCTAPPGWGEIHHSIWWSRGGHTNTHHGILLCRWHHRVVHQRQIAITRHHDHWHFTRAGGHPISYRHPPPCEQPHWDPPPREPALLE